MRLSKNGLACCLSLFSLILVAPLHAAEVIHVFVALCDNASQGIVPVPAKIGDGDKPDANLYWGCSEGVRSWFSASKKWKRLPAVASPRPEILERVVFKHRERDTYLIADAWRGREIKPCLQAFVHAAGGLGGEVVKAGENALKAGGDAALVAYIGHNGLMEFNVDWPAAKTSPVPAGAEPKPAVVLACISQSYFAEKLKGIGAHPLLTTRQLMYPGAFALHDALEARFAGKNAAAVKEAAARAYAKNQGISVKAASGVFAAE
ncbi:hypothetical protein DES53_10745 [Roseimicrobium gellanilyticum]|uniref:Uncharacterized protein n=1 Tax=Roseimicrobium gellanilyticum TaxID=748857 RepID=A0A366HH06_9BACT|nr:hypothetical protein [Roseimicrobium gellanilyticum]RBP41216.1 hypothetical protein DES53_10745 [Roseimicrobium gellanilyticum]